jgi:hypothetical protein
VTYYTGSDVAAKSAVLQRSGMTMQSEAAGLTKQTGLTNESAECNAEVMVVLDAFLTRSLQLFYQVLACMLNAAVTLSVF